jgi:hypothetical protein
MAQLSVVVQVCSYNISQPDGTFNIVGAAVGLVLSVAVGALNKMNKSSCPDATNNHTMEGLDHVAYFFKIILSCIWKVGTARRLHMNNKRTVLLINRSSGSAAKPHPPTVSNCKLMKKGQTLNP